MLTDHNNQLVIIPFGRRASGIFGIHETHTQHESCEEKQPLLMLERLVTLASEVPAGVLAGGVERHPSHQRPRTRAWQQAMSARS